MKKIIHTLIIVAYFIPVSAQEGNTGQVDHTIFDELLKVYVSPEGKVNYRAIKQNISRLDNYLDILRKSHPEPGWTEDERKAYWINAYNAFTIKLVAGNYPVKSIKDISKSGSPWDIRFIIITGRKYSLGDIENEILRKEFDDPRIHFAINCASVSCPKLLNEAYLPAKLDSQLERSAKEFINERSRNRITPGLAELSSVFDWYKTDFLAKGSLIDYINKFSETKIKPDAKVRYMFYNWNLNE